MEDWKKQDRNLQDQYFGICRTGKWRTILQDWKMEDRFAGLENAGLDFEGPFRRSNVIVCTEIV